MVRRMRTPDSRNHGMMKGHKMEERKHNYPKERASTGPRPQAGRKPKLANPKRVTVWVEEEQLAWVLSQGDKSEVIRRLIAAAMSKPAS